MKSRFLGYVAVLGMLLGGQSGFAQNQPKVVGKLSDVQGLVTVSSGNQLINATQGAALVVGNRIITTSSGGATLDFDNGCNITLKANESITVRDTTDCKALLASVSPVGGAAPGTAVAAGGGSAGPWVIGAGAVAIALIVNSRNNNSNSAQ